VDHGNFKINKRGRPFITIGRVVVNWNFKTDMDVDFLSTYAPSILKHLHEQDL
jgi:hypothetical protein